MSTSIYTDTMLSDTQTCNSMYKQHRTHRHVIVCAGGGQSPKAKLIFKFSGLCYKHNKKTHTAAHYM